MGDDRRMAFLFDLDGTLVDSVYQHVVAWREALEAIGIELSIWRIHRRIGMSGGLFLAGLLRETGRAVTAEEIRRVQQVHAETYGRLLGQVRPLPGARELLDELTRLGIPWAIATSGRLESARKTVAVLGLDADQIPLVTRDHVRHAKPDPDLFLAGSRASRRGDRGVGGGWGQCLGYAGRPPRTGFERWPAFGRLRSGRTPGGGSLPGVRRSGRSPATSRRSGCAGGRLRVDAG